jgi:hypothetical protein
LAKKKKNAKTPVGWYLGDGDICFQILMGGSLWVIRSMKGIYLSVWSVGIRSGMEGRIRSFVVMNAGPDITMH